MYSRWIGRSRIFRLRQTLRAASAPQICCQHDTRRRPFSLEFPTSHIVQQLPRPHPVADASGLARSRAMRRRISRNSWRGIATSAIWNVTYFACCVTLAPIFTNFSRSVVSDQCFTPRGSARRRKRTPSVLGGIATQVDRRRNCPKKRRRYAITDQGSITRARPRLSLPPHQSAQTCRRYGKRSSSSDSRQIDACWCAN
jgi:hypothetical protein